MLNNCVLRIDAKFEEKKVEICISITYWNLNMALTKIKKHMVLELMLFSRIKDINGNQ